MTAQHLATMPISAPYRVYFARAIDGQDLDGTRKLASLVAHQLAAYSLQLVDPTLTEPIVDPSVAATGTRLFYGAIVEHDLAVLRTCDAVLMDMSILNRNYIGCVCEMTYAYLWQIPCVLYVGSNDQNRPWLQYHATAIFRSRAAAIRYLVKLRNLGRDLNA